MNPLTPQEKQCCQWCLEILEEEQISECQDEAELVAFKQVQAGKAYSKLLPLLVKMRVAEIEADLQERNGT